MNFLKNTLLVAVLLLMSVAVFGQAIDGHTGITTSTGAPTWTRVAGDAVLNFDKTSNSLYYNDALGNTWAQMALSPSLASGNIFVGSAGGVATGVTMSGDATISNTGALTLASTITAGGPTGSATTIPVITYDAKGRLTAVTTATVAVQGVTDQANGFDLTLNANNVEIADDWTELTALGAAPAGADLLKLYDDDAAAYKTMTITNLLAAISAANNFVTADLTATADRAHLLNDNSATALAIGAVGSTSLLTISTLDAGGAVGIGEALNVTGTTTLTGALVANGSVTLGDAGADVIIINGTRISLPNVPAYANQAAATTGGVVSGDVWKASALNSMGQQEGTMIIAP